MSLAIVAAHWAVHGESRFTVIAAQSSAVLWYLTRMTAVSAYIVLTLSALLGMARGVARGSGKHLPWTVDELHQVLATTFGGLVLLHLITLYYHTFIPFTLMNFLVPGSQPYRPLAVNLGVLGLYGLAVVLFSSWFRRKISYRVWRRLHYASFVTFVLVTLHGLLAGSDAGEPWMRFVYIGSSAAVGVLVLMRLFTRPRREPSEEKSEEPEESEEWKEWEELPSEYEPTRTPTGSEARFSEERWQRMEELQNSRQQTNQGRAMPRRDITTQQRRVYREDRTPR